MKKELELGGCVEQMTELRKWMAEVLPDSFPEGEKTDFSFVIESTKDLILHYIRLRNLVSR